MGRSKRITRSRAHLTNRTAAAQTPVPTPAPASSPTAGLPIPAPNNPLTSTAAPVPSIEDILGVVSAAQSAAAAYAVSPVRDDAESIMQTPPEGTFQAQSSPMSGHVHGSPLCHMQSSPSRVQDRLSPVQSPAQGGDSADQRPPPTEYPDERNDYDGKSLRWVAQRYHYKLPTWYHDHVTDDMLHNTHPVSYVPTSTPQPSDVADHSEYGVMLVISNPMRQSLSFAAAYLGFKRVSDFKCFAQTKGKPEAQPRRRY